MRKLLSLFPLLLTLPVSAALINGNLNINTTVRFSAPGGFPSVDYLPLGGNTGSLIVSPSSNGSFAGLGGSFGVIKDLTDAVPGPQIITTALALSAFPTLQITITSIDAGIHPQGSCASVPNPKAGQTCTPTGSILNLVNLMASASVASFQVRGYATDGSADPISAFTGVVTIPFSSENFQEVATAFQTKGFVESSAAGSFVFVATPEPASMTLGGMALVSLAFLRRRKEM